MKLPESFVKSLADHLPNEVDSLIESLDTISPISIRINQKKFDYKSSNHVTWCHAGYYLENRPAFIFDPLFHAGCYYVQEASSMFLEQALRQYTPKAATLLDLCGAPGGKTTLALANIDEQSFVVANEIVRSRAYVLNENLAKTGLNNYIVLNSDAHQIGKLTNLFDVIIADVPCSGEGMFRKDPHAIEEWSEANVLKCTDRQKEIINAIWSSLRPGGVLIYSTCTYNRAENENQIEWICAELGAESLPIDHTFKEISTTHCNSITAYRFFPHKTKGEGFFLSVVRKKEKDICTPSQTKRITPKNNKKKTTPPGLYENWLRESKLFSFEVIGNEVYAFRKEFTEIIHRLSESIEPLYCPLHIATIKGKDIIPTHYLALSCHLMSNAFPRHELSYKEAIMYLKKEALIVSDECPKGFVLVTFGNIPLGFIKNMGNRSNNLYPSEWRIRTTYMPTVFWSVLSDRQL